MSMRSNFQVFVALPDPIILTRVELQEYEDGVQPLKLFVGTISREAPGYGRVCEYGQVMADVFLVKYKGMPIQWIESTSNKDSIQDTMHFQTYLSANLATICLLYYHAGARNAYDIITLSEPRMAKMLYKTLEEMRNEARPE
ncbi:uncharacterized protein RCC_05092 [Ramularia collo-cygni]|uniref:Uncharacterized protein n=1 Tax=Ramularia collo-cygni TaxID=112498 RepID=A0A2D3V6S0_9PEZI|nr:uncharacterized protein RCC_05092 [Ramularia collo-cygni]CZT19246.1 uncharacterized protein RCC_05092 [Ramularia collo-cygni]